MVLSGCGTDRPAPDASASPDTGAFLTDNQRCRVQQRQVVGEIRSVLERVARDLEQLVWVMPRREDALLRRVETVETRLGPDCVDDSLELAALAKAIRAGVDGNLNGRAFRDIERAFKAWARSVGVPVGGLRDEPRCPTQDVTVRIVTHHEPEPGGVRAWAQLVIHNGSRRAFLVEHGGIYRASHVRPKDRTVEYSWGGSSSDILRVAPGRRTTKPLWPAGPRDHFVHLFPGGRITEVYDVYLVASGRGTDLCPLRLSAP